jgi:nitrogen regulatory protein PII
VEDALEYMPRVKLEIVCQDELVEEVVAVIEQAAHTGLQEALCSSGRS